MSKPRVSVLIPVYNREKFIGPCIASALAQSITDLEVVVVDNASDDGTWAICQEYAARDDRVRLLRNAQNIGPVRNWQRCVEAAQGEFAKILFSDDLLEPDCLEKMLAELSAPDVGMVFCAARIGESVDKSVVAYQFGQSRLLRQSQYLRLLLVGMAPVSPGAILLRTADLKKNLHLNFPTATARPFERHGAGPDVMISLLTAAAYRRVAHIDQPLVFFRAHAGSFSVSNTNNEVTKGYISAISYYLKNNEAWSFWIRYMADSWLACVRSGKSWINPLTFLRDNEGRGSILEIGVGLAMLPSIVLAKAFTKLVSRI